MSTARAFWTVAPGQGALQDEALSDPGEGEALVRTRFSGISRGTESLVFAGRVPASEHARMRCPMMGGDFPFPVKYGYSAVGVVEERRYVRLPAVPGRREVALRFVMHRPLSPQTARQDADPRPLGIALRCIRVERLEED